MPPPLCFWVVHPSICPSVCPSEAQNSFLHGSVGPSDQPWHFTACPSVLPSGEVPGHLLENAWREWPEILHADVSWPPSELIRIWPRSVDFYLLLAPLWLSETGQICGFWAFPGELIKGMAWNLLVCWCILTTFSNDKFMVLVCWFLKFCHNFDLVKFGVTVHFPENAWRE